MAKNSFVAEVTFKLIIEKIATGLSNVQGRLTPLDKREEPEEQLRKNNKNKKKEMVFKLFL